MGTYTPNIGGAITGDETNTNIYMGTFAELRLRYSENRYLPFQIFQKRYYFMPRNRRRMNE